MYEANSIIIDSMIINDTQNHPTIISVHKTTSNYEEFTYLKSKQTNDQIISIECRELNIIQLSSTIYYNYPNLEYLDIRNNNLLKMSPKFKLFKNLKTLKIDCNSITVIPSWISEFKSLTYLSFSNNLIKYIPSSICQLKNLLHLDISFNKIDSIPIEIGDLQMIEILMINNNYFIEIPTTMCRIKQLKKLSLEWFEFTERTYPYEITIFTKENILEKFSSFLNSLLRIHNMPYCTFTYFISNFNTINTTTTPLSNMKILYAVEMNYYGVVKDYILTNPNFSNVKNGDNKTMLYLAFDYKMNDLCKLLLHYSDVNRITKRQYYLNKAIRFFNYELAEALLETGADFNEVGADGNTPYHILFSIFTRETIKYCKIGELLIKYNIKGRNQLNHHGWGPIHIAIRKGNLECLKWTKKANEYLKANNMKEFDFDLAGKNGWTPIHLTVNDYKIEETLFLYYIGCNIFKRNKNNFTPKQVSDGNYLLTKYLIREENRIKEKLINKDIHRLHNMMNQSKRNKVTDFIKSLHDNNIIDYNNDKYDIYLKNKEGNCLSIENVIRNKLQEYKNNGNLFCLKLQLKGISDICQLMIGNNLFVLLPLLVSLKDLYKSYNVIAKEIENTIIILNAIKNNCNNEILRRPKIKPKHNYIIKEYTNAFSSEHCKNKIVNCNHNFSRTVNLTTSFSSLSKNKSQILLPIKTKSISNTKICYYKNANFLLNSTPSKTDGSKSNSSNKIKPFTNKKLII